MVTLTFVLDCFLILYVDFMTTLILNITIFVCTFFLIEIRSFFNFVLFLSRISIVSFLYFSNIALFTSSFVPFSNYFDSKNSIFNCFEIDLITFSFSLFSFLSFSLYFLLCNVEYGVFILFSISWYVLIYGFLITRFSLSI